MTSMSGSFKRHSKAALARQAFRDNPDAKPRDIAKKYKVGMNNVYMYRDQVRRGMATASKPDTTRDNIMDLTPEMELSDMNLAEMTDKEFEAAFVALSRGRGGERTPPNEQLDTPAPVSVDETLNNRAAKYGRFVDVAATAQGIVQLVGGHLVARNVGLENDQAMSLYMIATKLARIAHGDPHDADNWLDIAGYATLVAERLSGKEPR